MNKHHIIRRDVQELCIVCILKLTFLPDLDGAGGLYPLPVFVPLSGHVLHGDLTNKHGVLIFLDVQVLQGPQDLQLTLCREEEH